MKLSRAVISVGLAVLTAVSMAQGFGGGGGRQNMGMRMMGNSKVGLLMREDVKEELKITSEQQSKFEANQQSMMEKFRQQMQNAQGSGMSREDMMAQGQKMMAEGEKMTMEVLTPEQKVRLKELHVQYMKERALTVAEYQKEAGLTTVQVSKIDDLNKKLEQANRALWSSMRDSGLSPQEVMGRVENNNKILGTEIQKLLTAEQKSKLTAMGGKPFTFKEAN